MNKYFKYYFFLLFFLFFFNIFFSGNWFFKNTHAKDIYGKARIIDGDSIEINNKKIRFLGIDAFEKKQECFRKDGAKYKCGESAISNLSMIISGQPVRCVTKKKDKYKRWLATCYIGKLDINENMVLYGNAFSYMSKKYKTAENEAKKIKAGAWNGEFVFPWKWRKLKRK
jgi:endonuclease YncB( thermonuclease family)